jgi:AraC family transcriptional activator of pyochelin receptor
MHFALDNRWETQISGGFAFCLSTPEPLVTSHLVKADSRLSGVFLHVPDSSFERLGIPAEESGAAAAHAPRFNSWSPGRFLGAIAQQIADCPYQGPLRSLFLEAKSLELLVAVLASRADGGRSSSRTRPLSRNDTERLVHGREILLASLSSPPSLDELARRVGMSTSRLTAGFRQLFSMSVVEFIQEQRLAVAMATIREGRRSISQAAFDVGYTPAHFSTLFRKRYGYPPSLIARR